jgi:hypothetical protein
LLQEIAFSFLAALTTDEPMTPEDFSLFLWWLDDIMVFWEDAALSLQATDRGGAAAYRHAGRELMRELSAFKKGT